MIFSLVALLITVANVFWYGGLSPDVSNSLLWLSIFNQVVASGFALLGLLRFRGQRLRPNYQIGKPPIWTLGFAFRILTLIAALGAILLPAQRFLGW